MDWKKIGKALLSPHIAIMLLLLPLSTVALIYSLVCLETKSLLAIISYLLAFYTLVVWSFKLPQCIRFFKAFREENKYIKIWRNDAQLKVTASLYISLICNAAYALMHLCLGIWHRTFWFYSIAGYYIALASMRLFLLRHTKKYAPGKKMLAELRKYRTCGIIFLVMNLALTVMIFFMVYWNKTFHEITTITMALYTFSSLSVAIIHVIKYRKYNSPVYSASKAIRLASASVSLLTLETTMLTTFGDGTMSMTGRRIMLGTSGGVLSAFIISMAISMIVQGTKKIRLLTATKESPNGE